MVAGVPPRSSAYCFQMTLFLATAVSLHYGHNRLRWKARKKTVQRLQIIPAIVFSFEMFHYEERADIAA